MKALDDLKNCLDESGIFGKAGAIGVNYMRDTVNPLIHAIEKELEEHYIELPLDKDGVPINVGDEMVSCGRHRFRFIVSELDFMVAFVRAVGIVGGVKYFFKPSEIVHYHKNPIEDMLRNIVTKARQIDVDGSPMLKENDIRELSDKLQLKEDQE